MLNWILSILAFLSLLFGIINGKMADVNLAALQSASRAVELCLTLIGTMALWNGLMRIAEKSGLCKGVAALLSPLLTKIFKNVPSHSRAMELISINVTANLLGLANASTPLGIAALQELSKFAKEGEASDDMVSLVVLNTASIQLVPTTVAILRLKYGADSPLDILPAVFISSFVSLFISLLVSRILSKISSKKKKRITG